MPFDLSSFKVLIKKIFPPKKTVFTADTIHDNKPDSVIIRAYNVIVPFEIPEKIIFEDVDPEEIKSDDFDFSNYLNVAFDGKPIDMEKRTIDKNSIEQKLKIAHQGEIFSFQDIITGKMGGRTLGLGDTIDIIIKLKSEDLARLTEGKHTLELQSEMFQELTIHFELNKKNMNISYEI